MEKNGAPIRPMTCFALSVSYVQENLAEHAKIVKKRWGGTRKFISVSGYFLTKKVERTFCEAPFLRTNLLKRRKKLRINVGQSVRQKLQIIVGQSSTKVKIELNKKLILFELIIDV